MINDRKIEINFVNIKLQVVWDVLEIIHLMAHNSVDDVSIKNLL